MSVLEWVVAAVPGVERRAWRLKGFLRFRLGFFLELTNLVRVAVM